MNEKAGARERKVAAMQLRMARSLLAAKGGWCKKSWAVDRNGQRVPAESPCAAAWCAFGALRAVHAGPLAEDALIAAFGNLGRVFKVNDTCRRVSTVLRRYDRAIASLQEGEA